ncbi:MAG: class I SAM-dependent rRNA methyltransferase [Microthrixaceae bacterium]
MTADALRQVRGGHPWVFASSVIDERAGGRHSEDPVARPLGTTGDLAVVFDSRRRFVAVGLYDARSPIRVRVLHSGRPRAIDPVFLGERIVEAVGRRAVVPLGGRHTGFRLVHGENDRLPGLVVDRYDDTLVAKVYTAAWIPRLGDLAAALTSTAARAGWADVVGPARRGVLRYSRDVAMDLGGRGVEDPGAWWFGPPAESPVRFVENGLAMTAEVLEGQKTGYFLDQRDNRTRVGAMCRGAEVLDVFSCSGGFSVNAAAGGAHSVLSVDRSAAALGAATSHFVLNSDLADVARCRHRVRVGDAFDVMADLARRGECFDVVVVDPPSFAHRARDREGALRAYRRLAAMGSALVRPGGSYVQSSCSSRVEPTALRDVVLQAVATRRPRLRWESGHGVDHPIGFREGAYLSTVCVDLG